MNASRKVCLLFALSEQEKLITLSARLHLQAWVATDPALL